MQKRIKYLFTAVCLFFIAANLSAEGDCYIYDRWGDIEHSPDAYSVEKVYVSNDIGAGKLLSNPQGLFVRGNYIYLCDTGNNRIIQYTYNEDRTIDIYRVITSFNSNGEVVETFNSPSDIYVDTEGTMYIADTDNARVVKITDDLNYELSFLCPDDPTYDKTLSFMPQKVIADVAGRVYLIAKNINKGFIKYENDGKFTSFWGASEVHPSAIDLLWKKIASRRQREQMESFVPTEFSNVFEDREGFLYATLRTFDEYKLMADEAKPIRRLNALGGDILIKNAPSYPIGDLTWESGNGALYTGPSRFEDITVLDNDVYIALDGTRGKLFAYNNQGYLLFAFGGKGNHAGYFKNPIAIEHINGRDLIVLDSQDCSLTVFSPTHFGNLVYDATELFASGRYEESGEVWQEVLLLNGNYDLAYVGLGKVALRQDKYKEAMDYFAVKKDRRQYSKAFVLYRKDVIEKYIGWVIGGLLIIVVAVFIIKKIRKIKREVAAL